MRFTDKGLSGLKAKRAVYTVTETGCSADMRGLQCRVQPSGTKTLRLRYKVKGEPKVITLGYFPATSIAEAHRLVQKYRAEIRDGKDPAAWREDTKEANEKAPTLQAIYEDFRDEHLRKKLKQPAYAENVIENHVLPKWGERVAASITRKEIIKHFRGIADRSPRVAHVARTFTAQLFAHAVNEGSLAASPAVALPTIGSVGEKREVKLTDDQLRGLWSALDAARMVPAVRLALRLLLVTGQRRQEVALARWAEIDLDGKTWTIPAANSKNGKEHVVPLSALALDLLAQMRQAGERTDDDGKITRSAWLVPSRSKSDRHIDPHALTRAMANNSEVIGIEGLTPHAFRHTVATRMSALGVERLHVAKVLNHSDKGITGRYDQHDYLPEKRAALDLWATHLQAVLDNRVQTVVPIKAEQRRAG